MTTTVQVNKDDRTFVGSSPEIALRRRSVIQMIILTVVTLGFYYPIWFLRRRRGLNSLNSPRKLARWPFVLFITFFVIQFSVGLITGSGRPEDAIGATAALLLDLLQLAMGILIVVQCFFIKDILEEHLMGPEVSAPSSVFSNEAKLSGAMTFVFTIFFLQHVINREVLQPPSVASRSLDPAPEIA
jgi:uncharacterized protein DUF4234